MSIGQGIRDWWNVRLGRKSFSGPAAAIFPSSGKPKLLYGLGALAFIIILLVVLSGVYLAMFFQPGPAEALNSVRFTEDNVALGFFARSLHRWGAFGVLFVTALHIFSTIYRGAYHAPRELNWLSGIFLLLLIMAFIVTGFILPWDFRAYWTVKTISNWLESLPLFSGVPQWLFYTDVPNGSVPVGRWFAVHAVVLPLLTGIILAFHYILFRQHGSTGKKR